MNGKWNSRKLSVAGMVFAVATAALFMGKIDGSQWCWVTSITMGTYLTGQGITDAMAKLRG